MEDNCTYVCYHIHFFFLFRYFVLPSPEILCFKQPRKLSRRVPACSQTVSLPCLLPASFRFLPSRPAELAGGGFVALPVFIIGGMLGYWALASELNWCVRTILAWTDQRF